jgi:hypothetical protein
VHAGIGENRINESFRQVRSMKEKTESRQFFD